MGLDFTDFGSGLSGLVFKSLMCWLVKDPDGLGVNALCCLMWALDLSAIFSSIFLDELCLYIDNFWVAKN